MTALSKFLVLLAIFLLEGYANAFLSLSQVAGNQLQVNPLIQFEESYKQNHILNPRTGLVSPQFHVFYANDFSKVPYLCTAAVPPDWAKLVEDSSILEVHTEQQVGAWQSLPELDVEPGDFTSDTSEMLNPTINQDCERKEHSRAISNVESPHNTKRVNI